MRHREKPWTRQVAACTGVYQNGAVSTERPATGEFTDKERHLLGLAITRARERMGLSQRELARRARISRTPLWKLENGEPVTAPMYEAVARVLPGWTEDTPRGILEGRPAPGLASPAPEVDTTEPAKPDYVPSSVRPAIGSDEWLIRYAGLLKDEVDYLEVRVVVFRLRDAEKRNAELERLLAERRDVTESAGKARIPTSM